MCLYSRVYSAVLHGLDGRLVTVEADLSNGLPGVDMVGALSTEVREAMWRVRTALKNMGFSMPPKKIVINLAPASLRKTGTGFDLPIAVAALSVLDAFPGKTLETCLFVGELGLEGEIRPVPGVMSILECAAREGLAMAVVPKENEREAKAAGKLPVFGVSHLNQVLELLKKPDQMKNIRPDPEQPERFFREELEKTKQKHGAAGGKSRKRGTGDSEREQEENRETVDFSDIRGQEAAKRAAEIAAAGGHNLILVGAPGAGKSMIAKALSGILPSMTWEECREVSRIYSVCGKTTGDQPLVWERPFQAPHHTVPVTALTGGGMPPKPGVFSLATHGILFFDEFPEFSRGALEALRQPLEERNVVVSRLGGTFVFPADFMLVAAMNPCPCGCYPNRQKCTCSDWQIRRYQAKLSRPLLDRFDLGVIVEPPPVWTLQRTAPAETSEAIRNRVTAARRRQQKRAEQRNEPFTVNAALPAGKLEKICMFGKEEDEFWKQVCSRMEISARAYYKILRTARTIADLEGTEAVETVHLKEALSFRADFERVGF